MGAPKAEIEEKKRKDRSVNFILMRYERNYGKKRWAEQRRTVHGTVTRR